MRALFVTTGTADCQAHVGAWESAFGPAETVTFPYLRAPADDEILKRARDARPQVIFYIGAANGFGLPSIQTFRALRDIAPTVNLCSDAADPPWHPVLDYYREKECFDLQVSIDGARGAPVDLVTLTPVNPFPFQKDGFRRDILFGFSGTAGPRTARAKAISMLKMRANLVTRPRHDESSYQEHVDFLLRCRATMNVSFTGSQSAHHVKGRVLEAGWAGCTLFEYASSPAFGFFPTGCLIRWENGDDVVAGLQDAPLLVETAMKLSAEVRARWTPTIIYGRILESVGLSVPTAA